MAKPANVSVLDPQARAVVDGLQARARAQYGALLRHYLPMAPWLLLGLPLGFKGDTKFYRDKLLPIEPGQGELLYVLARSKGVRRAVEFGTSFGVSTIYLAAAMRDAGAGGRVIGTEMVPDKVAAAASNLTTAGLAAYAEILPGDARITLRDMEEPVDLLLLDGWPALAMDVLRIVEPRLADGALVIVDNVGQFPGDLRPVVNHLTNNPRYRSSLLPLRSGTLVGICHTAAVQ